MATFKQGKSSKYYDYMNQLIHKIHEAEELLLSGDDRHLEDLKEIADMIGQYVSEAQGHKFEPAKYQDVQGQPGQNPNQPSNYYPEYPQYPRRGGEVSGNLGYIPYRPYIYPFYNEGGQSGSRRGEGYTPDYYDRRR